MIHVKNNPIGIDIPIQSAQKYLHSQLMTLFEITDNDLDCFGRTYRNKTNDGYIAEVFTVKNEYKEVYWNDRLKIVTFFGLSDLIKTDIENTSNIHLVFFCNLKKLMPSIIHRADEEIRQKIYMSLGNSLFGMKFKSIELGVDSCLKEYPGSRKEQLMKYLDMHPIHCFRFNYTLSYDPNKIC